MLLELPAIRRIRPLVKPLGFKQDGRFFYRITGDVTQQFCLVRFSPRSYTIRFRVGSVYDDAPCRKWEGEDICRIINGTNWFLSDDMMAPYLHQERGTTEVCAEALERYLLPWFESAADSERAWRAAKEAGLFLQVPGNPERMRYCYDNLGFFLGMGDWDAAEELLGHYIAHSDHYNQTWWKPRADICKVLHTALLANDQSAIADYMAQRRTASCREFRWKEE